jgi:YfiH family protein
VIRDDEDWLKPDWPAPARVRAAMTLRSGGVSVAPYDTLNLGTHVGDDPSAVAENRKRVRESLQLPSEPAWLEQVHGTQVALLPSRPPSTPLRADAAVSWGDGSVCAIQVADCLPVLLTNREGTVIAAAHAGWRGLASGVLENTVRSMDCLPANLIAWLGPAISQPHFEVGDEVRTAFVETDSTAAAAFTRNDRGRWQCDLYSLARQRLTALGLQRISGGGWCTYAERDRFFSFRRDGCCGRMAALIWLKTAS